MNEYIEIFQNTPRLFDEMVKMDGKSIQSMCVSDRKFAKFCSKDNEKFWEATVVYVNIIQDFNF